MDKGVRKKKKCLWKSQNMKERDILEDLAIDRWFIWKYMLKEMVSADYFVI
jgi:hypothetical protein